MNPVQQPGLPERLNYKCLVAPGVIQLKDGAFLAGFEYWGPDQEYASYESMEHLAEQINRDLTKLGSGWMLQVEAMRFPVVLPHTVQDYPDLTSLLIAEERAAEYEQEGKHYETRLVFTLTWLPPVELGESFSNFWFPRPQSKKPSRQVLLSIFQAQCKEIVASLDQLGIKNEQLTDDELVRFLHYCVTGEDRQIGYDSEHLDTAIGATTIDKEQYLVGSLHTRVVGVFGFPCGEGRGTFPQMLDDLLQLPYSLRFSQRFIFLGSGPAIKELEVKRKKWGYKNWYNPKKMGWATTANVTKVDANNEDVVSSDEDATEQARSVKRVITKLREGKERAGYYTLVVIVQDEDEEKAEKQAAEIILLLSRKGFSATVETDNWTYALRGSWSGHGTENVRKPQLTTRHFARLWITSSAWRGYEQHPSPLYPQGSGPLLVCKSTGFTPFFMTPPLHSLIIGPTGGGKTVLINSMSIAQLQYEQAQVFTFDLDAGGFVPNQACGGEYFDLDAMKYSPLAYIDKEEEYAWALDFCERLATLRGYTLTPQARIDLEAALRMVAKDKIENRWITGLLGQLQTRETGLRSALSYYAGNQPGAILDGKASAESQSHWLNFDMEQLRKRSEAVRVPVLLAQLHTVDRRLSDKRPTQIYFEEGWWAALEALLRDFIEESSATARKKVVSTNLVLHSPGDLQMFPHADRLLANIGTYIFLPNDQANTEAMRKHYSDLGLNSRVIRMLAEDMRPRRDYLMIEGKHWRRFQLPWGQWQGAILGVNGRDHKATILELKKQLPHLWFPTWLRQQGHRDLAEQWTEREQIKEAA